LKIPFLVVALLLSTPAFAGDVSVSIGINEPGFYGQISIGDYPRPSLVYAQPVIIERAPAYYDAEPIYLHVPPGHEKHWRQHCAEYHACGRRVYFVQDHWYRNESVRRQEHREDRREDRRDERRDDRRDERRNERHEDHGKAHGRGRDDHERGRDDRDH
jgi:hypothetical protein